MRWLYFTLHFLVGFSVLWLSYTYANVSFLSSGSHPLWLEGPIETSYLVAGVAWGNAFTRRIPRDSKFSLVAYVLSLTIAPVAIFLPVLINIIDLVKNGVEIWWRSAVSFPYAVLNVMAVVLLIILFVYRRSESAVFYRTYNA